MTSLGNASSKQGKIDAAMERIPNSTLFTRMSPRTPHEWAGILASLDEDKVDDLLLLLEQEGAIFAGGRDDELWENYKEDRSEYLERLNDLKIAMEEVSHSPKGDE